MSSAALASAFLPAIAGRGPGIPDDQSDGVATSGTQRLRFATADNLPMRALKLIFGNFYIPDSGVSENDNPNPVTIKPSIEHGGVIYPMWINGRRSYTLAPGEVVAAELHPRARVIAGEFFLRNYISVASAGMTWPLFANPVSISGLGEGNTFAAPGTDLTERGAGAVTAVAAGFFSPVAVLGEPIDLAYPRTVGLIGDSVFRGATSNADAAGNCAMVPRWLAQRVPYVNLARNGDRCQYAVQLLNNYRRRDAVLRLCNVSDIAINYGINDAIAGRTDLQIREDCRAIAQRYLDLGVKRAWICTLTPHTASTDGWATLVNQTPGGELAVRIANNNWRRGVPAPFHGLIECADPVESARDSGLWSPGLTTDGIHPGAAGCAAGVAALGDALRVFPRAS